jgi:DNA-binding winged helix-turn-helix (wHTH) protein
MPKDHEGLPETGEPQAGASLDPVVAYIGNIAGDRLVDLTQVGARIGLEGFVGFDMSHIEEQVAPLGPDTVIWIRVASQVIESTSEAKPSSSCFAGGRLVIDHEAYEVTVNGALVRFQKKEYELLSFMAKNRRRVFTHPELYESVWGDYAWEINGLIAEHIRKVRNRLGDLNWVIQTKRGVGYLFDDAESKDPSNHTK